MLKKKIKKEIEVIVVVITREDLTVEVGEGDSLSSHDPHASLQTYGM